MKNWTIGKQITFGFGAVIVCVALLGLFSLYKLRLITHDAEAIAADTLPCLALARQIGQASTANRALVYRHIASSDPANMTEIEKQVSTNAAAIGAWLGEYEKTIVSEVDRNLFQKVAASREAYRLKQIETLERSRLATNSAVTYAFAMKELEPVATAYAACLQDLAEFEKENGDSSVKDINTEIHGLKAGFIVGILLVIGVGFWLATTITRRVNRVLVGITKSLAEGSEQIVSAATQVSVSSQTSAEGASEQAASLEETGASLEEISSMTKRNAENASNCKSLSSQACTSASSGLQTLKELSRTLDSIKSAVAEMQAAVTETQSSSQEISKIIKTIDEIAFQTNLLALNAAVEAARAGEAGAGFAVVADEVRALAQRSAQAARDTSDKIEVAVKRSELGGIANTKVVKSLTEVETTAQSIQQVFNGIVTQIQSLDQIIAEIAAASKEQSQGIGEVNMAVSQMDKVTQSNAANAEENAASSEELNAQAATLQDMVMELELITVGRSEAAATTKQNAVGKSSRVRPPTTAANVRIKPGKPAAIFNRDDAAFSGFSTPKGSASKSPSADPLASHFQNF